MSMKYLPHEMRGAAPMTAPGIHCDMRPFDNSAHILVFSSAKEMCFTAFRQIYLSQ
jgi:hypothetical protein